MKIEFKHEKQLDPKEQDGFRVNYMAAKRAAFKTRWYLLLLLVVSPLLVVLFYFSINYIYITGNGILTSEPVIIYAKADGVVNKIYFKQGDALIPHQKIFDISSAVIDDEKALLEEKLLHFKQLKSSHLVQLKALHQQKIKLYERAIKKNESLISDARKTNYKDYITLTDRISLHIAKIKVDAAEIESEIKYDSALEQHDSGSLASIILELERALTIAQAKQSQLSISMPTARTVNEVYIREGEFVEKGDRLMMISNRKQPVVHLYLKPKDLEYAEIGNKVTIIFPDGKQYKGEIKVPVQVANKIPAILADPFGEHKSALVVQIDINEPIPNFIEGLPVKVRDRYFFHSNYSGE